MKFTKSLTIFGLFAASVASAPVIARPKTPKMALVVGWHDEMNDLYLWSALPAPNRPDIFTSRPGTMTLRMPQVPQSYPYTYQWGGVTGNLSVDLGRYPVLVAHISRIQDGSYAHMSVSEDDYSGKPARELRSPALQGRGLSILDVGQAWGSTTQRMTLKLYVGGANSGASCEYAWVRFVRREDIPKLQAHVGSDETVELQP